MEEGSEGSSADGRVSGEPVLIGEGSLVDDDSDDAVLDTSVMRAAMAARLQSSTESIPSLSVDRSDQSAPQDESLRNDSILSFETPEKANSEEDEEEEDGPKLEFKSNSKVLEELMAAEAAREDPHNDDVSDSKPSTTSFSDIAQLVELALGTVVRNVVSTVVQQAELRSVPETSDVQKPETVPGPTKTETEGTTSNEASRSLDPAPDNQSSSTEEPLSQAVETSPPADDELHRTSSKVHSDELIHGLFAAAACGDLERVRRIIFEEPILINVMGVNEYRSESLMHAAATSQNDEVARFLMRQEVKPVVVQNDLGREPLHIAVLAEDYQMVKSVYDGNIYKTDTRDKYSLTALHYAGMIGGHVGADIVHFLVRMMNFDIEKRVGTGCGDFEDDELKDMAHEGETVIHIAARFVRDKTVRWLVELGVDLSKVSVLEGRTALHLAIINSGKASTFKALLHLIKVLMVGGINVDTVDCEGRTGLHYAAQKGLVQVVDYLLRDGMANARVRCGKGMTPLLEAARHGHATCVDVLQNFAPESLDDVCADGNSALHYACVAADLAALQVLLDFKGIDVHLVNAQQQTAAQFARAAGADAAAEMVDAFVAAQLEQQRHAIASRQDKEESAKKIQNFLKRKASRNNNPRARQSGGQHPGPRPQFTPLSTDSLQRQRQQHRAGHAERRKKRATLQAEPPAASAAADMEAFVEQFHVPPPIPVAGGPAARSPRGLERADTQTDLAGVVKEFVGRFASAAVMELCCGWRAELARGTGGRPGMGFEDMVRLLEALEMLGGPVSRSEVYRIFFRVNPEEGTALAPATGPRVGREITLSQLQSYMRSFAARADAAFLHRVLRDPPDLALLRAPQAAPGAPFDDDSESSSDDDDAAATEGAGAQGAAERSEEAPARGRLPPPRFLRSHADPENYLPTMTGVNSPDGERRATGDRRWMSRTAPAGASSGRRRSLPGARGSTSAEGRGGRGGVREAPRSLGAALQGFTWCQDARDKVRVSSEDPEWLDGGASWTSGRGSGKGRGPEAAGRGGGSSGVDLVGELAAKRSTASMENLEKYLASEGVRQKRGPSRSGWTPTGCGRSRSRLLVGVGKDGRGGEPPQRVIANLGPWLRHLWPDYSPAVAPMPHLVDAAHDSTYHQCLSEGDYLGCMEVVTSSLARVSRSADPELYQRVYAQAAVFCVFYALRSLRAKKSSIAIALLKRADLMTAPGDVEYAGRKSLRGWTMDVMAQYYLERGKANAALQYMRKAMQHISSIPSSEGQAAWRAHLAAVLSALRRPREALEVVKEALGGVVGEEHHTLSKSFIKAGRIPHAHRKLAAALCFNLAVSHAQLQRFGPALTSARFANLIAAQAPAPDIEAPWLSKFESFADALRPLAREQAAKARPDNLIPPATATTTPGPELPAARASGLPSASGQPGPGPASRLSTTSPSPASRSGSRSLTGRPVSQPLASHRPGRTMRGLGSDTSSPTFEAAEYPVRPQTTVPGERPRQRGGPTRQGSGRKGTFPALSSQPRPRTSTPSGGVEWLDEEQEA